MCHILELMHHIIQLKSYPQEGRMLERERVRKSSYAAVDFNRCLAACQ